MIQWIIFYTLLHVAATTMTPTPSCSPTVYFLDANNDGLIDVDGAQWYGWYNSDSPSSTGDYETIAYVNGRYSYSLSSELYFCPYPIDVKCVTADAAETPWYDLNLDIFFNKNFGCWCQNDKNNWACVDMKAQFLCPPETSQAYYGCNPPANYISANNSIASMSNTPSNTHTPSNTPSNTPTPSATQTSTATCSPALYFLDADHDGFLDIHNAQWYGWYSIDGPGGLGEYEHIAYVNGGPGSILSDLSFCPYPLDVQCVEINSEIPWNQLGLNIHYDPHFGCTCLNSENNNACVNMKIKYLCPPESEKAYYGCNPPIDYSIATNPLASYSNSVTSTSSGSSSSTSTSMPSSSNEVISSSTTIVSVSEKPSSSNEVISSSTTIVSSTEMPSSSNEVISSSTTIVSSTEMPSSSNELIVSVSEMPSSSNEVISSSTTIVSSTEMPSSSNEVISSPITIVSASEMPSSSNRFVSPSEIPSSSNISFLGAEGQQLSAATDQSTPELVAPLTASLFGLLALAAIAAGILAYRKKKNNTKKPIIVDAVKTYDEPVMSNVTQQHQIQYNHNPFNNADAVFNNPLTMREKVAFAQVKIQK
jgi:hypothetical protein